MLVYYEYYSNVSGYMRVYLLILVVENMYQFASIRSGASQPELKHPVTLALSMHTLQLSAASA
jgi:hypothetical protein